jgi:HSP20 family molecular chaperone IbpA
MKLLPALALFFLAAPAPEIRYFQFERPITMPAQANGQTCAVLDPSVFAHASVGLADLRVYQATTENRGTTENQGTTETPYAVRSEIPVLPADQKISPLNLGKTGGQTVFDAEMPGGTYSDIQLEVSGHDFLATVTVSGSQAEAGGARTKLGSFTIFDLTRQRLGRSTVLHLPESDFHYLHFQIAGPIAPENVTGLP